MRSLALIASTLLISSSLMAEDLDQLLDGFDEEPTSTSKELDDLEDGFNDSQNDTSDIEITTQNEPKWYNISGYTSLLSAYNYNQKTQSVVFPTDKSMDFSGLSRVKAKAGLTLEMKHGENWKSKIDIMGWYDASWAIKGKENYTDDVLETYEYFYDVKDAYIQGSLTDSLDIKIGRQIVIWGKSDSIRITDVINPLDNTQPGMVDIEDLRLSEVMSKLDYYFGDFDLSLIAIHEPRLQREAAFGSDYRPSDVFGAPIPYSKFPDRVEEDVSLKNTQFASSLDGHFSGWDISFYASRVYSDRFSIKKIDNKTYRKYYMINMGGVASNVALGSFLLKAESAFINNINYRSTDHKNRLDSLVGFDYMGISDSVISLEFSDRHIFDFEKEMLSMNIQQGAQQGIFPDFVREDTLQVALRGSYSFNNDNATITYLATLIGGNDENGEFNGKNYDGGFQRLWITYKYNDSINLESGVIDYIAGDSDTIPFYNSIKDNDRVYAQIEYKF